MDKKIKEYRTKHKKCKWCKFYKYHSLDCCAFVTAYSECILKDKVINFDSLPRLCKYYELKECVSNENIN